MTATIENALPQYMRGNCHLLLPADAPETEWRHVRRGGLGASDMSTILGLNPWSDLHSLWMNKVHGADQTPHDRMLLGHALEPFIREKFVRDTEIEVEACGILQSDAKEFIRYTPDGLTSDGGLFEAKSTAWWNSHHWDDGQVADHAEIQVQCGMYVTGAAHAWVAAMIDGNPDKFEIRRVERDDTFIEAMVDAAELFWLTYVMGNVEPPLAAASLDWAKERWTPEPLKQVDIGDDGMALLKRMRAAKEAERTAKEIADECEAQIRALVQDGSLVTAGDRQLGTLKTVHQNRLSKARMKEDGIDPSKYTEQTSFNRFFWKKGI